MKIIMKLMSGGRGSARPINHHPAHEQRCLSLICLCVVILPLYQFDSDKYCHRSNDLLLLLSGHFRVCLNVYFNMLKSYVISVVAAVFEFRLFAGAFVTFHQICSFSLLYIILNQILICLQLHYFTCHLHALYFFMQCVVQFFSCKNFAYINLF